MAIMYETPMCRYCLPVQPITHPIWVCPAEKLIRLGYVCVRCGGAVGLETAVVVGEGLVHVTCPRA